MVVEGDFLAFVREAVLVWDDDLARRALAELEAFEGYLLAFFPGVALILRSWGWEAGYPVDC